MSTETLKFSKLHPYVNQNDDISEKYVNDIISNQHPILSSFYYTQFMVNWITPIFKIANQRQLLESDIWELPSNANVKHAYNKFSMVWNKINNENIRLNKKTSLFQVLMTCYWKGFLYSGILQVLFLCFQLAQPFVIIEIVKYVSTGQGGIGYGIGLACILGLISLCSSLTLTTVLYMNRLLGISVKAGIMTVIYEQALHLTSASRLSYSVGQITNLVGIDSDKLFMAVQFPHFLW